MTVPVVFLSKTIGHPCSYIKYSMSTANLFNEDVWLIGDDRNKEYCIGNYESLEKYKSSFEEFESLYIHLSTIHPEIEKFCFSRWFILKQFMIEHNLEQVLHLDTDILFFANASDEANRFKYLDCALSGRTSGHSSYWTLEGLTKFCDYVMSIYSNKNSFDYDRITSVFTLRERYLLDGGVCDMTLLEHYARYKAPHLVGELSIFSDNLYYDHIIGADEGFEFSNGRKIFHYKNGKPYSIHIKTGKLVPFATIHFQGTHNKYLMEQHYDSAIQYS